MVALPGLRAPIVTYRLTEGDMSCLARASCISVRSSSRRRDGAVPVGGGRARRARPRRAGGVVGRSGTRNRTNLMTVHLTSSVRMGEDRSRTGADSFDVWGSKTPASAMHSSCPRCRA